MTRCSTSLVIVEIQVKTSMRGNSLVVQWLGLHVFTAKDMGSIPAWGTETPQAVQPKKKKTTHNEIHTY